MEADQLFMLSHRHCFDMISTSALRVVTFLYVFVISVGEGLDWAVFMHIWGLYFAMFKHVAAMV